MNKQIKRITLSIMLAALNYIAFAYGKISIPITPGINTAIHIANAIVVLSGWILGPYYGGLAGGIGLPLADIMDPRYITSAPKTFIMKFIIGYIAGISARKLNLYKKDNKKDIIKCCILSSSLALLFNVIFDPIIGYFYKKYILALSIEAASILLAWSAGVTFINAIACIIISTILYRALYRVIINVIEQ